MFGIRPILVHQIIRGGALLLTAFAEAKAGAPPRVLVLFSNDRLLPANLRYDEGMREALDPEGDQKSVALYAEFLDAIRLEGADREAVMETYLRDRYRDLPPQVVVPLGPQALEFFLERRERLFAGVPLLFGGISAERLVSLEGLEGVGGLPMDLSVVPAVEALLEMRPETREIVLVHGTSDFDRAWRDRAMRQCAPFADRVTIRDYPEVSLEELEKNLAALPPEAGVVFLTYFRSPTGETYTPAQVVSRLAAASSVPMMGTYDTYLGSGMLGVSASPFKEEGRVLGGLIRRVLTEGSVGEPGILPPNPTRLILDHRQMERWGIASAPAGAEVRHRKLTLWQQYRTAAIVSLSVMAVQGILITGLILARLRQERAERELRHSESLFTGVFRGSPAAISIVRQRDGLIVDVNPVWEAATGVSRAEAIGRTPLETGMEIGDNAEARFRDFLQSGKSLQGYEQVQRTSDGRTRLLSLSTELLTLHDEPCFIIVATDVTEQREAEDARRQLVHTSRLAMVGEMTASIAHEINQPLGAILSNTDAAEMLLERANPPLDEVRAILVDIRRDDRRASEVIKRVRALVGQREILPARLDLNEVLHDSCALIRHDAQSRGVTLVEEYDPGLPGIHADAVQIEQVVLNLLLNAMDAMEGVPVASRTLWMRSARRDDRSVEVRVTDNGPGIPPETLGRIFDSFYTTKENGMGLGLSLVRSIVEAHGGSIQAENHAGRGVTFHLVLPLGEALPDPDSHD